MGFDFGKLPPAAKRAAFAHMGAHHAGRHHSKALGSGARHQHLATQRDQKPTDPVDELHSAYQQGHTDRRTLTGGNSADEVKLVDLHDGRQVVQKEGTARDARAEYLAGRVANTLGITDVHTAQVSNTSVITTFVEGDTGIDAQRKAILGIRGDYAQKQAIKAEIDRITKLRNGREIGMLDWLTNNDDRHSLNYIVSPDGKTVYPVDHGSADFETQRFNGKVVVPRSPFVDVWIRPKADGNTAESVDPQWTAGELATIRSDLEGLQGEFSGDGEQAWHASMLEKLQILEKAVA